jgi:small-conductance mechanosensitive channel
VIKEFLDYELFTLFGNIINVQQAIVSFIILIILFYIWKLIQKKLYPLLFDKNEVSPKAQKGARNLILYIFIFLLPLCLVWSLGLDYFFSLGQYGRFSIILCLGALLIFQLARLADWFISNIFIHKYYSKRDQKRSPSPRVAREPENTPTRTVTTLVYIIAFIIVLRSLNLDYTLFTYDQGSNNISFNISKIFQAIFILVAAKFVIWLIINILLYGYYKQQKVDTGAQYAINKLLAYVLYVIAVIFALQALGINMTLIWGGAAALLVGIGLGLQQTFNDFFSGIVLLFERSVEVGDVLSVDNTIGTVRKIGIRSSIMETRENVSLVVPNSKIVNQNVINWSHLDNKIRFNVDVGVAYGSDVEKVKALMLQAASENKHVMDHPSCFVRFTDFGESSLDFQLLFFSRNYLIIEDVKSDLRFAINKLFKENNVTIPFPQRDVWLKKE